MLSGDPEGHLVRSRQADDHGAEFAEAGHESGVGFSDAVGEGQRAPGGGPALDIENLLDPEGTPSSSESGRLASYRRPEAAAAARAASVSR